MNMHLRWTASTIPSGPRHPLDGLRVRKQTPAYAQHGVALVVALILLVVITLVGLAAVSGTIMQNKMASNQYDRQLAFQQSESTLRQARKWLLAGHQADPSVRDCTTDSNPCLSDPFTDPNKVNGAIHDADAMGGLAAAVPQYVVERVAVGGGGYTGESCSSANFNQRGADVNGQTCLNRDPLANYYRITARSGDPQKVGDRAIVTLQSVLRVR